MVDSIHEPSGYYMAQNIHREYVHSVAVYQKYLTRLGESIIFEPIYFSTSDLLRFIMSNTDKHEFSSIWKWIRC